MAIRDARTDAAARRAAAELQRRTAVLIGSYLADENDRAEAESERHREVLRQFPDLVDEPYLILGGWVIHGERDKPPRRRESEPAVKATRSFFGRHRSAR